MRNPERIRYVAEKLVELWEKWPDYRLGQLMWLAAGRDPFHIEDYDMLKFLAEKAGVELDLSDAPEYWVGVKWW